MTKQKKGKLPHEVHSAWTEKEKGKLPHEVHSAWTEKEVNDLTEIYKTQNELTYLMYLLACIFIEGVKP